ncbi:unnamed protein product, partial [Medioppia subpectinata]
MGSIDNIFLVFLTLILICFSLINAQNVKNSSIETINVLLNDLGNGQIIESPGFPTKPYPKDYKVNYEIKVNLSERIQQLSSRLRLTLEYVAIDPSDHCKDTNLQIIFPKGELRTFCGLHAGKTMVSDSGSARIEFRGNSLGQDRGYKIRAEIVSSKCSQKFVNQSEGIIQTPNYPKNYGNEDTCVWDIEVPKGKYVKLDFDDTFAINAANDICAEDYLLVSQSGDFDTDVQRFCGNQKPDVIISDSNRMLIKFNSNSVNTGKGFRAKFVEHNRPEAAPARLPELTPEGCPCGKENLRIVKRIVGGKEVDPAHRYPWMVSVGSIRGSPFCGGALINNFYVLTAAHCVYDEVPESIGVRIGQHSLQESTPILKITKITVNDKYNSVSQKDDIALLRLAQPIKY